MYNDRDTKMGKEEERRRLKIDERWMDDVIISLSSGCIKDRGMMKRRRRKEMMSYGC